MFVALDGVEGKPTPVPSWKPDTDDDRRMAEYAIKVMELSKGIEQTIAHNQEPATQAPATKATATKKAADQAPLVRSRAGWAAYIATRRACMNLALQ